MLGISLTARHALARVLCAVRVQVAWMKKAPANVQKASKPDMILVHYFDGWAEVQNTPSMCVMQHVCVLVCAGGLSCRWGGLSPVWSSF